MLVLVLVLVLGLRLGLGLGLGRRGTSTMCSNATPKGVAYESPSICQPVVPTPTSPSASALDMRSTSACGARCPRQGASA